jgi:hypothetical protein
MLSSLLTLWLDLNHHQLNISLLRSSHSTSHLTPEFNRARIQCIKHPSLADESRAIRAPVG